MPPLTYCLKLITNTNNRIKYVCACSHGVVIGITTSYAAIRVGVIAIAHIVQFTKAIEAALNNLLISKSKRVTRQVLSAG